EVAVVVEDTGVEKLILHLGATAAPVGLHQVGVGIGPLRVLIKPFHVGVGRRRVKIKVVLFDVLAVVGFAVGQAEKALFENRVLAVPQRQRKTEPLVVVGKTGQAVLAPAISAGPRMIVGKEIPGIAVLAVVLSHRAPLALAQVGAPLPPRCAFPGFVEAHLLCACS